MRGLKDCWEILPFCPSSPILWLCSWTLTFILELKPKETELCSACLSCLSGKVRGETASVTDCHISICTQEYRCLLSTQVQHKNPWADQNPWLFLQGWKGGRGLSAQHLLKLLWLCSLCRLSLVLLNPLNGRPSCKTCPLVLSDLAGSK